MNRVRSLSLGVAVVLQLSCYERPQVETLRLTAGNASTTVSDAVFDSMGNLVVVGETLASNLATPGTLQRDFGSSVDIQYFDPASGRFEGVAMAPVASGELATLPANRERVFLVGFSNYRRSKNRWIRMQFEGIPSDLLSVKPELYGAQETIFAGAYNVMDGARYYPYLSRDGGASWRRLPESTPFRWPEAGPLFADTRDPCRVLN